jgi:DNA invertase Pin-like site-specific DNA recombinase
MAEIEPCVIVPRVSTSQQVQGTSLDTQEEACVRLAGRLGSPIYATYREEGVSGSLYLSRKDLQQALRDIEAGRAKIFITYEVDRAGRDVDVIRAIAKRIRSAGGRLFFAKDGTEVDYQGMGKAMLTLRGVFAELELDQIRERTTRGFDKTIRDGIQPSRTYEPFGYYIVKRRDVIRGVLPDVPGRTYRAGHNVGPPPAEGTYVIVEEQARYVLQIFARYAAGCSLRQLTLWLEAEAVPTPRGGKCWHASTVEYILRNPVYKGQACNGRHQRIVDEERCLKKNPKTGKDMRIDYKRQRDPSAWKFIAVEPLVTEAVWEECQRRLGANPKEQSGNPKRRYWLSGILRCPKCGRAMSGATGYYLCRDAFGQGNSKRIACHPRRYRVDEADGTVLTAIRKAARSRDQFAAALRADQKRRGRQASDPSADIAQVRVALEQLQDEEKATVQAQVAGIRAGADASIYAGLLSESARKRAAMEAKLKGLIGQTGEKREPGSAAERWEEVLSSVDEALQGTALTAAEQHLILSSIVERIVPEENAYRIFLRDNQETVQKTSIFCANSGNCQ